MLTDSRSLWLQADSPPDESQQRILVVDDHEGLRRLLTIVLERSGYEVMACEDGHEALAMLRTYAADLVLLDLALPRMTGYEILQAIRSNPNTSDLPVIFLTAHGETDDVVRGLQSGANDYVTKPFEEAVLLARVGTHLRLKRLVDQRRRDIERLEQLDALKDRFVVIASHDLRGPLGTVISAVELLRSLSEADQLDATTLKLVLDSMDASATNMRAIISDFLDLHAIRAGGIELNLRPIYINGLIDVIVDQYRYDTERKEMQLHLELDSRIPEMMGDAERLLQVLSNLISNAIKYSSPGSAVKIRSYAVNNRVRVEVADQGPGIPEDEMPYLFKDFIRLRNRPTGGEASSGVGLSITRDLVRMHSGEIGVESKVGIGSMFWIEFPCEERQIA